MAGKAASGDIKAGDLFAALRDLIILALLMVAAAAGGYYWGLHERVAPLQLVAPGTPGALPATAEVPKKEIQNPLNKSSTAAATNSSSTNTSSTNTTSSTASAPADKGKLKYWLVSSGTDYVGYQIIVNINDQPVDNFFGPGKLIDVTRFVKHGDNTITFDSKNMGEKYNKHKSDSKAELKVQLVAAPHLKESWSAKEILASAAQNATDSEDDTQTFHFTDGD